VLSLGRSFQNITFSLYTVAFTKLLIISTFSLCFNGNDEEGPEREDEDAKETSNRDLRVQIHRLKSNLCLGT
jgi:hypothetical protein